MYRGRRTTSGSLLDTGDKCLVSGAAYGVPLAVSPLGAEKT